MRDGILKLTISSPTLAQGLNLSATAVVFHSLHRGGELVEISEFKNVIGRAGRAYVDVEGVVLFPMFNNIPSRRRNWEELIQNDGAREMESGLVRLVWELLLRMRARIGGDINQLVEYVVNNAAAWTFPEIENENLRNRARELNRWKRHIATLDTAILSLIGESDIPDEEIEPALDDILQSSLWHRYLRRNEQEQRVLKAGLVSRSRLIWSQSTAPRRRGYFLAGVGLSTGHALDEIAEEANCLLVQANIAIQENNSEDAISAITALAALAFNIVPFAPDPMPENWRDILRTWLSGQELADIAVGQESATLLFIERGLVYRLPWALEAIRVRAAANGDTLGADAIPIEDHELGLAVPAVETGTLNRSASILIQAGFNSRIAAIRAVTDAGGNFRNGLELRQWLNSEEVAERIIRPDWPTAETKEMWTAFMQNFSPSANRKWTVQKYKVNAEWLEQAPPCATPVQIHYWDGQSRVLSPDGTLLGTVQEALNPDRAGLLQAHMDQDGNRIDIYYLGPADLQGE